MVKLDKNKKKDFMKIAHPDGQITQINVHKIF